ncbi:NAD(P)-binding protein [Xylariomycetidae sp. FL2044]|nr:NAD(P)-binding protein [Xylariomycetidae sp. FL2044]
MVPKIFLTGATGYAGGEALYSLHKAHPEYEYTLLVRDRVKAKHITDKYPNVRLAFGDLDSADVIESEAAAADVVLHAANSADNMPSALAIAKGIAAGHTAEKPGHWIHLCGTGLLIWYDVEHRRFGQAPLPEQTYHDIDDIERITSLPHSALHRDVDEVVLAANDSPGVRTMIVSPPVLYGRGRGLINQRSMQIPRLAQTVLTNGFAPIHPPGLSQWDNLHISDLGAFYVLAVEAALDPSKSGNPEIFGPRGYFFLLNGTHKWSDAARWVAEEAEKQGLLLGVTAREVMAPNLGTNSVAVGERAKKYLGWVPSGPSLRDTIAETVAIEAKILGRA